jgi:hypothetical protein
LHREARPKFIAICNKPSETNRIDL